jgi:hypothetical protein
MTTRGFQSIAGLRDSKPAIGMPRRVGIHASELCAAKYIPCAAEYNAPEEAVVELVLEFRHRIVRASAAVPAGHQAPE